uniref:Predicted protein n=1 Tax=Hordeum vulgare subsp. vulgare TaxID=112509 RepID=F2E6L0_HORVV|nr:predicted protein [Hordeum vulgare subsp. vulgare]
MMLSLPQLSLSVSQLRVVTQEINMANVILILETREKHTSTHVGVCNLSTRLRYYSFCNVKSDDISENLFWFLLKNVLSSH